MRKKITKTSTSTPTRKWEVKFETEHTISTWKYKSQNGITNVYEVVIDYKDDTEQKKKRTTRKKNS